MLSSQTQYMAVVLLIKNNILKVDTTIFPSKLDTVKSIQIGLVTNGDDSWINE
jgi:hypothetical protein